MSQNYVDNAMNIELIRGCVVKVAAIPADARSWRATSMIPVSRSRLRDVEEAPAHISAAWVGPVAEGVDFNDPCSTATGPTPNSATIRADSRL